MQGWGSAAGRSSVLIWLRFSSAFLDGGNKRRGELFVEGKEVFDALAVVLEGLWAVTEVHGTVQFCMGSHKGGRHRQRIVEVGE